MRRCVPIALILCSCGGDEDGPTGPASVAVLAYDYAFDLESRDAAVIATLRIDVAGDCVELPMRASGLADVMLDGEPIDDGELEGGILTACGRGWEVGEEIGLEARMSVPLETWGESQVGYSVSTDAEGAPFHYLVSWIGGCDRFGPCDSAPDRFASYRFTVTHPPGMRVLCPGTIEAGETETVCQLDQAAPTYSGFGLAAGPSWREVELGSWAGGVRATLYDMPSVDMAAALDVDAHDRFLAWMAARFGPYPYGDQLRFFVGPTYWSGFEHPGNIALSDLLHLDPSAYADPLTHVVNHEIAHQWAGDQTTLATTHDFVWKEAMAEYLSFVFEEEELSQEIGLTTARAWKLFAQGALFHPVPEEAPPLLDYYGDVYGPGPMILFRQIEGMFGREPVMAALAELLGEERALSVDEVQAALEAATGADLANYFDVWVRGTGAPRWPLFEVEWTQEGDAPLEWTVRQTFPAEPLYGCAFAIAFVRQGQRHEAWVDLGPDGVAELSGSADPGFAATNAVVDPNGNCLAFRAVSSAPAPRGNPWISP
jgi:aminopeptidase N